MIQTDKDIPLSPGLSSILVHNTEYDVCVDGDLADPVLVEEERHEALASLLLPVGVDPHEPVGGPVLGADAEHPRLELLPVLHLHLLGEVGDAPGVVILGVRLVVGEGPGCGHDGRLLDPRRGWLTQEIVFS